MTDASNLDIAMGRAARAADLINNELLRESFTLLSDSYTNAWKETKIEDVASREKLFLAVNIVGKVQEHLIKVLSDGKLAAAEVRAITEAAERKKRFGIL
jgi:hypothetical protein